MSLVHAFERPIDKLPAELAQALGRAKGDFFSHPRRGNIILVEYDGLLWSKRENLPQFVVINLPGVPDDIFKEYARPIVDPAAVNDTIDQVSRKKK